MLDNSNLSKFWTILIYAQFFGQAILFARPTGLAKIRRQRPKYACDRVRLGGTLLFFVLYYLDIASGVTVNNYSPKKITPGVIITREKSTPGVIFSWEKFTPTRKKVLP